MLEVEEPKREQVGEDGLVNLGQVVVREVDGVKLVQLRERPLRDVDDGVVAHVQHHDARLVVHRNLQEQKQLRALSSLET